MRQLPGVLLRVKWALRPEQLAARYFLRVVVDDRLTYVIHTMSRPRAASNNSTASPSIQLQCMIESFAVLYL